MSEHELWNELGDLHFLNGSYERALQAYHRAITFAEADSKPYNNLAVTCTQLGRYADAVEYYQRGIQLLADAHEKALALRKLGDVHLHLKEYPQALSAFEQADTLINATPLAVDSDAPLDDSPTTADVASLPPASASGMELLPFIEELTPWWFDQQTAPEEDPPMLEPWLQDEVTFSDNGENMVFTEPLKWEIALAYQGTTILAEAPPEPDEEAEKFAGILDALYVAPTEATVTEEGESELPPEVIVNTAETVTDAFDFSAQDMTDSEAVQYKTLPEVPVVELSPEERAEIQADIEKYKRTLEINPRNAFAWDALGGQYKALSQYDDAIQAFQKAVSLDSSKAYYFHHLGLVYAAVGRQEDALHAFERVIEIEPHHSLAHATLGGYFRRQGNEELAQAHIEQAQALIATDENEYNRACMEAICGNTDRSLELLEIALKNKQTYVNWARKDPDLDFVRTDPRFNDLLVTYAVRV